MNEPKWRRHAYKLIDFFVFANVDEGMSLAFDSEASRGMLSNHIHRTMVKEQLEDDCR